MRDSFSAMKESSKKLKSSDLILTFLVCSNRNKSAFVSEVFSNNSLFVGQLYEDLIFFTTDIQTVNYYSTIHC